MRNASGEPKEPGEDGPAKRGGLILRRKLGAWSADLDAAGTRGFNAQRVVAGFLTAAVKNPMLTKCTSASVFLALVKTARLALDIDDGIFLVPLQRTLRQEDRRILECHAWPSYTGLKALAARQGTIRNMMEYEVYEADEYKYEYGSQEWLRHVPCKPGMDRGPLIAFWTKIILRHGHSTFWQMSIDQVEEIRKNSREWGPTKYRSCPPWYGMKTVARDWLNRQPKAGADQLGEALRNDDIHADEDQPLQVSSGAGDVDLRPVGEEVAA